MRKTKTPMQMVDQTAPGAPGAGSVELYSRAQRLRSKNAAGREFDLQNIVESVYINGTEQTQGIRIETRTFTTGATDFTLTFTQTFVVAPMIVVQAFSSVSAEPTIAEVLSVSTTQAVIRTYRGIVHNHPLGAARTATQREGAFCNAIIIGMV